MPEKIILRWTIMSSRIIDYILDNFITAKQSKAYRAVYIDHLSFKEAESVTGLNPQSLRRTASRAASAVNRYLKFARFVIEDCKKSQS